MKKVEKNLGIRASGERWGALGIIARRRKATVSAIVWDAINAAYFSDSTIEVDPDRPTPKEERILKGVLKYMRKPLPQEDRTARAMQQLLHTFEQYCDD